MAVHIQRKISFDSATSESLKVEEETYGTFEYSYLESGEAGGETLYCTVCHQAGMHKYPKRKCCGTLVCKECIEGIIQSRLQDGLIYIPCPNPECEGVVESREVLSYLEGNLKERYVRMKIESKGRGKKRACPNCNYLTKHRLPKISRFRDYREDEVKVKCAKCQYTWCFNCHGPWHLDISCKENQRGDKKFHSWTEGFTASGTAHCHSCPTCGVYIQRSTGCNHMICNRCETEFCYRCGDRFIEFPGLGDHYDELSIFGCKYNYLPNEPFKRKCIRGGYFAAKILSLAGYPALFVLAVATVVALFVIALPIYYSYKGCLYCYRNSGKRYYNRAF